MDGVFIENDPWIPRPYGDFYVHNPLNPIPHDMRICHLFKHGGLSWNIDTLMELFTIEDVGQILTLPLSLTYQEDSLSWHHNSSGIYTVKSYYKVTCQVVDQQDSPATDSFWSKVWKVKAPAKIKNFLWQCFQHILPTKAALLAQHVPVDPHCPWCGREETVDHVFIICPRAQAIWAH